MDQLCPRCWSASLCRFVFEALNAEYFCACGWLGNGWQLVSGVDRLDLIDDRGGM